MGGLVDQHVGLVGDVAGRAVGGELEPVVAHDNVLVGARLGVGHDAVGAGVANVGAVQRHAAVVAVEDGRRDGVKDARDGAHGAARRRLKVLLHVGAGGGGGRGLFGIRLGVGDGGGDGALLGAAAVALGLGAFGLGGRLEGSVDLGGLDAVDGGRDHVGVVQDLTGNLGAVGLGVSQATCGGNVEVATGAEIVDSCGVPLDLYGLSGLDSLEGRVAQVLGVDIKAQAAEGNLAVWK